MKNHLIIALKVALAVVAGYLVMVLLITLVQEVIFGGISYHESSLPVLSIAGMGTMLAGAVGGWLGGIMYKHPQIGCSHNYGCAHNG